MRLVVRADATSAMGSGHVMRCLGLAQSWQDAGGTVDFLTHCESDALARRIRDEGFGVRRLNEDGGLDALRAAQSDGPEALVVDGYQFDANYQRQARDYFCPLIAIDDLADLPTYSADFVLNQNIYAPQLRYSRESYTRLLLGCQFALLRREFLPWAQWRREFAVGAPKLLVTVGGTDPRNVTARVLDALAGSKFQENLETVVVVSSGSPYLEALRSVAGTLKNVRVRTDVADMPALMAWADIAITAGGSTCWETAFMGLPSLIVVVAANQLGIASGLETAGTVVNLGWHESLTPSAIVMALDSLLEDLRTRRAMSEAGRQLVTGCGARNVVQAIKGVL